MVDGHGRLGETQLTGLTDTNKRAVFPQQSERPIQIGDMVAVNVIDAS